MDNQTRMAIHDLIVDIHCAYRDGQNSYAEHCKEELRRVWKIRHGCTFNRYGVPIVPTISNQIGTLE